MLIYVLKRDKVSSERTRLTGFTQLKLILLSLRAMADSLQNVSFSLRLTEDLSLKFYVKVSDMM